jgi:hypothetical protein
MAIISICVIILAYYRCVTLIDQLPNVFLDQNIQIGVVYSAQCFVKSLVR